MITLVLGGTRSGKSMIAEQIAQAHIGPITYVATASVDSSDTDHVTRVAAHQARRPRHWNTVECADAADLPRVLHGTEGAVLVDSLGTWVTLHPDLVVDATELVEALSGRGDPTVIVSEEVGLAIHPPTEVGRRYIDAMGDLNQQVAEVADRVILVVAGRAIDLARFEFGPDSR